MSLKKRNVENENLMSCCKSRLFGITEKAESVDIIKKSEASFYDNSNYKGKRAIRDTTLEAEIRKAQSLEIVRRYLSYR